jgi:hypothetical protein
MLSISTPSHAAPRHPPVADSSLVDRHRPALQASTCAILKSRIASWRRPRSSDEARPITKHHYPNTLSNLSWAEWSALPRASVPSQFNSSHDKLQPDPTRRGADGFQVIRDHSADSPTTFLRLICPMATDPIFQTNPIVKTRTLRLFAVPAAGLPPPISPKLKTENQSSSCLDTD